MLNILKGLFEKVPYDQYLKLKLITVICLTVTIDIDFNLHGLVISPN